MDLDFLLTTVIYLVCILFIHFYLKQFDQPRKIISNIVDTQSDTSNNSRDSVTNIELPNQKINEDDEEKV